MRLVSLVLLLFLVGCVTQEINTIEELPTVDNQIVVPEENVEIEASEDNKTVVVKDLPNKKEVDSNNEKVESQPKVEVDDLKIEEPEKVDEAKVEDKSYTNSMWVWKTKEFLGDSDKEKELFKFSKEQNVDTLYVYFSSSMFDGNEMFDFIKNANEEGLKIYYLTGDSPWALTENYESVSKRVKRYLDFGKFEGIHFDIERPHDWFKEDNKIALEFLGNLKKLKEEYPDADISLDVPFWLDTHEESAPFEFDGQVDLFSSHLRKYTSFLTIMDYNDNGENMVKFASNEMGEGPTVIGIEFSPVEEAETVTFYEENKEYFDSQISIVEREFEGNNNFKGFAFHYYKTFASWNS